MKSLAHLAGFSLALALAGLGAGCSSTSNSARYRQPAQDFEVVETSAKRPLTDTEMNEVRSSVAAFLDREGATDSGDYFLKVYLTPENVDAESEWVVVRFTRYTTQRVALVSAYTYDDLTYSPYYSYDLYPYGYGCVSRISFQYYVDPFYNRRYYHYPRYGHGRGRDRDRDDAHNHGRPNQPPGNGNGHGPDNGPGRPLQPPRYTGNRPPTAPLNVDTPTRYNRNNPNQPVARVADPAQPPSAPGNFRDNAPRQWQGRPPAEAGPSGLRNAGNRPGNPGYNRNSNPNPSAPDYRPANPTASNPTPANVTPPTQQQWRNRPSTPPTSPTGVNNSQRTADRVTPANRPAPSYRQSPPASRPAPSTQSAPARSASPSYQAPARSAPPSGGNNGNNSRGGDRQGGDNQRDTLR